jgi:hypothetical protein
VSWKELKSQINELEDIGRCINGWNKSYFIYFLIFWRSSGRGHTSLRENDVLS